MFVCFVNIGKGGILWQAVIDFREGLSETGKAFDEDRVLLRGPGKQVRRMPWPSGVDRLESLEEPIFTVSCDPARYTYKLMEESGLSP